MRLSFLLKSMFIVFDVCGLKCNIYPPAICHLAFSELRPVRDIGELLPKALRARTYSSTFAVVS